MWLLPTIQLNVLNEFEFARQPGNAMTQHKDGNQPLEIAVSGSSGLVGSALVERLEADGHLVRRMVRGSSHASERDIAWQPAEGRLAVDALNGVDVVIHLGGESIASGRWTESKRRRIRESRVDSTRLLAETIARMQTPPRTLLCASAVGYYGNRGDEILTEEAAPGHGFLAETCRDWEAAAEAARSAGIRVVHLRFGVVLSPQGGALRQMLPLFQLGLGGRLGSGKQYMSWITLADCVGAICHVLDHDDLAGAVNVTAPEPVTNRQYTSLLAKALRRPAFLPAPSAALRLVLGPMADELLLASTRVTPEQLLQSGYTFQHSRLESAFGSLLDV